jgi:hypothetical protein
MSYELAGRKACSICFSKQTVLDSVLTPRFYRPENMPSEFLCFSTRLPLLIIAVACLTQCATQPSTPTLSPPDDTFWVDEHPEGSAKIVISLEEQRVGLFKGNQLIGISPISSGKEGNDTRPGVFKVTEKDEDHRSSWYGAFVDELGNAVVDDVDVRKDSPPPGAKFMGASMNWFMRFNGAIGMHQGYLPGYPASHGCIRLPEKMAMLFYQTTPHGTTVEVKKNADLIALRPGNAPPVKLLASMAAPTDVASSTLRSISPVVPGVPAAPMTLAPAPKPTRKKAVVTPTMYLDGYGPQ